MSSSDDWISALIERCLTLYLNETEDSELQVEDDGSNLRFTDCGMGLAVVDGLNLGDRAPVTDLTDRRAQIQAILTRKSIDEYDGRDLSQWSPKGYIMQLVDFEVVFEYSTSDPQIHFYVKRFNIDWERGKLKGYGKGKKITNIGNTYKLMREVFKKTRESQELQGTASLEGGYQSDGSIKSQNEGKPRLQPSQLSLPDSGVSQEVFASQAPRTHNHTTPHYIPTDHNDTSRFSGHLLGLLGSKSIAPSNDVTTNNAHQKDAATAPVVADTVEIEPMPHNSQHVSRKNDGEASGSVPVPSLPPQPIPSIESPGLRVDPSPDVPMNTDTRLAGSENGQRLSITQVEKPNHKSIENGGMDPPALPSPKPRDAVVYSDPWAGLTKIRKGDIKIPRNQVELLEDKRQWVPPATGESMPQGHVPPTLLKEWNTIALQKRRFAERNVQESPRPEYQERHKTSPNFSSSAPQADLSLGEEDGEGEDESKSGEDEYPWSRSPSEHLSRPRHDLPADSSPVRPRANRLDSLTTKHDKIQEPQVPDDTNAQVAGDDTRDLRSASKASNHLEEFTGDSAHQDPKQENGQSREQILEQNHGQPHEQSPKKSFEKSPEQNEPSHEVKKNIASQPDTRARTQEPVEESGDESDESDENMDTSVPCPLGASSQQASQPEAEITSSDPSLPILNAHERVQVVETPAAELNRLRPERLNKEVTGLGHSFQPQSSSEAAKSSSQSRIFNTYASHGSDPKGGLSQEISNHSLENEDQESVAVDIMGTQMSGGNWTMENTSPNSHFAFVLDSSEPKDRESSVPIGATAPHTEGVSDPFSSCRDLLSTQSDAEGNLIGSPQNTPSRYSTNEPLMSNLKRGASEVDNEAPSPSKRLRKTKDPVSNIISRRQSYISSAAKYAKAQRVYEKFQSDYSDYTGDFDHFTKLCFDLQCLRSKGGLQRSFLWDDFIIMHKEDYPRYLKQCHATNSKSVAYEQYFTSRVSKPSHKKRSLTISGIDVSAAQYRSTSMLRTASPSVGHEEKNLSFTTSLVNQLSNFHAHSLGPATQSDHPDTPDRTPVPISSPLRRELDQHTPSPAQQPEINGPEIQATPEPHPEDTDEELETNNKDEEEQEEPEIQATPEPPGSEETTHKDINPDLIETQTQTQPNNEDEDEQMEDAHSTASIELGDDNEHPPTAPPAPLPGVESEPPSEPESDNENWFDSLRHLRPTGPLWCDDPNTPFKSWARATFNVLSERNRRGWAFPFDNKGVIQRPYGDGDKSTQHQ